MAIDGRLQVTFSALADPQRRVLLARIGDGEATLDELRTLSVPLEVTRRQLSALEAIGLIVRGDAGGWRRVSVWPPGRAG
jgi:hypothetical protein